MNKILKTYCLIILLLITSICSAQKSDKELKEEKIALVLDVVDNVVKDFNKRNEFIKRFHFDSSQQKLNLIKFDSVKMLTIKIQKNNNEGLSILKNRFKNDNKEEIYNTGIKYLESIKKTEIVLLVLFDKMYKLIMGEEFGGEEIEKVNISLKNFETAKAIYKNEIKEYAGKNDVILKL